MAKTNNLKVVEPQSQERKALASAIANVAQAEDALRLARDAVGQARDRAWAASDRLDALREELRAATDDPAGAFISAMKEGREAATLELEAPTKSRADAESEVQREIDALNATREALSAAIAEREKALTVAKKQLTAAVAQVLLSEIDVSALLKEAEAAEAIIVGRRCELLEIQSALPASDERAAIYKWVARPWLIHEYDRTHSAHPAAQAIIAARDALMRDADAALGE
jgi:hypothetical protein